MTVIVKKLGHSVQPAGKRKRNLKKGNALSKTPTSDMNTMQIPKFLLMVFLTTMLLPFAAAEEPIDYYTPENVRKFADFLYEQGDYLRAAGEYQRYLFSSAGQGTDVNRSAIGLPCVIALLVRTEQAIQKFEDTFTDIS